MKEGNSRRTHANILLARRLSGRDGGPNPPYSLEGVGANTWGTETGTARLEFYVVFSILFQNAKPGFRPVSFCIEDETGLQIKDFDTAFPFELANDRVDKNGAIHWAVTLPIGSYQVCLVIDGTVYARTALYVLDDSPRAN